jgi:hypothetical protein
MPYPPGEISSVFRCAGVAFSKRENHASGTDTSRPSLSFAVSWSALMLAPTIAG